MAGTACPKWHLRMMSEIMDVPFPLAASRRFMSFLTFQISMFFSASLACGALMARYGVDQGPSLELYQH